MNNTLTAEQFDADLKTLRWNHVDAGAAFGKDEAWIRRMRKGEAELNPELAAWARKHAQAMLDDPAPQPPRVHGPRKPAVVVQAPKRPRGRPRKAVAA